MISSQMRMGLTLQQLNQWYSIFIYTIIISPKVDGFMASRSQIYLNFPQNRLMTQDLYVIYSQNSQQNEHLLQSK
ncbi:unnamed protein product [Paramecium octaurelia]|uniref:Uncharacterized protein n=1 Tax=Paramecium octaurelia TaxID=43137 RepID=A0A8S1UNQ7_PAROT|nr:unnamed protein product [Paramecium octaurelia]